MADTVSYPLFSDRVAGRAHLRVYSTDLEASRTADVAALADELLDAGFDVTVAAHHTPSVVAAIGRGWNEPRLTVRYVTSLVSLTAYSPFSTSTASMKPAASVMSGSTRSPSEANRKKALGW